MCCWQRVTRREPPTFIPPRPSLSPPSAPHLTKPFLAAWFIDVETFFSPLSLKFMVDSGRFSFYVPTDLLMDSPLESANKLEWKRGSNLFLPLRFKNGRLSMIHWLKCKDSANEPERSSLVWFFGTLPVLSLHLFGSFLLCRKYHTLDTLLNKMNMEGHTTTDPSKILAIIFSCCSGQAQDLGVAHSQNEPRAQFTATNMQATNILVFFLK